MRERGRPFFPAAAFVALNSAFVTLLVGQWLSLSLAAQLAWWAGSIASYAYLWNLDGGSSEAWEYAVGCIFWLPVMSYVIVGGYLVVWRERRRRRLDSARRE